MRSRYFFLVLFSILTVLSFSACSDDNPATPEPASDILLTIEFDERDGYIDADDGFVFASDSAGNVLDVATWSGTTTVVLKNSAVHPDTISFTILQHSAQNIFLVTRMGVPAGSVETFSGLDRLPQTGNAKIVFRNVPECWQFRMAYNFYTVLGWDQFPLEVGININGPSTDFFVRVDPLEVAPVGGWLRDIRPGATDTLDFKRAGDTAPLKASVVQIPTGGDWVLCIVSGIFETDPTRTPLRLAEQSIRDTIPESMTLYTPEIDPSNQISMFYQVTEGSPETFFWQESTGPVPASFTNLEGDISVKSTPSDSLAFTTTCHWDRLIAAWYKIESENVNSSWWVEGPAPIQTFVLPHLPAEVTDRFPEHTREDFGLRFLELYQTTTENLVRSQGKAFPLADGANAEFQKDFSDRHSMIKPYR